jgi:hypothetical protein
VRKTVARKLRCGARLSIRVLERKKDIIHFETFSLLFCIQGWSSVAEEEFQYKAYTFIPINTFRIVLKVGQPPHNFRVTKITTDESDLGNS